MSTVTCILITSIIIVSAQIDHWTQSYGSTGAVNAYSFQNGSPNSYITQICAWEDSHIHALNVTWYDGSCEIAGSSTSGPPSCYTVNQDECFVSFEIEWGSWINTLQFTTSDGYTTPKWGTSGQPAPSGINLSNYLSGQHQCIAVIYIEYDENISLFRFYYITTPSPTLSPSDNPTLSPVIQPTQIATYNPSQNPSYQPTSGPSDFPTANPTIHPTTDPSVDPTFHPTAHPSISPTFMPTFYPTNVPTNYPSSKLWETLNPTTSNSEPTVEPNLATTLNPIQNEPSTYSGSTFPSKSPTQSIYSPLVSAINLTIASTQMQQTSTDVASVSLLPTNTPHTSSTLGVKEEIGAYKTSSSLTLTATEQTTDNDMESETDWSMYLVILIIVCIVCICVAACLLFVMNFKKKSTKKKQKNIIYHNTSNAANIEIGDMEFHDHSKDNITYPQRAILSTEDEVKKFLVSIDPKIADACYHKFVINGWDTMNAIRVMKNEDLKEMDILPGRRRLILHHIQKLQKPDQVYRQNMGMKMQLNLAMDNMGLVNINSNSTNIPMSISHNINNINVSQSPLQMNDDIHVLVDEEKKEDKGDRKVTAGYINEDEEHSVDDNGILTEMGTTTTDEGTTGSSEDNTKEISSHPTHSSSPNYNFNTNESIRDGYALPENATKTGGAYLMTENSTTGNM